MECIIKDQYLYTFYYCNGVYSRLVVYISCLAAIWSHILVGYSKEFVFLSKLIYRLYNFSISGLRVIGIETVFVRSNLVL